MIKRILSFLSIFLVCFLSFQPRQVSAYWYSWSPDLSGYTGNMVSSLPSAQEWTFYLTCGYQNNAPLYKTVTIPRNEIETTFSVSDCNTFVNIIGIGINNLDDITPLDTNKKYLWQMRYNIQLANDSSFSRQWTIKQSSFAPRTLNPEGWSNAGWRASHLLTGFDVDFEQIDSQVSSDPNTSIDPLTSTTTYQTAYIGSMYKAPDYMQTTAPNLLLGNAVAGIWTVSPLVSLRVPTSNDPSNRYISLIKGSVTIIPEDALNSSDSQIISLLSQLNSNNSQISSSVDAISLQQNQIAEAQRNLSIEQHSEIMDDNTSDGQRDLTNFVNNFDDGADPTLSSIITRPIQFVQLLTTTACTPLSLPMPIINSNLTLPCGRAYISQFAPQLIALWDIISVGLIAYRIGVDLFRRIHEFKNPDNDGNVQALDL